MIARYLILSSALFSIGAYGVIARRNVLIVLMSLEIMLNAVNIALAAFAKHRGSMDGQVLFLMVLAVAAAEVAVGLSIVIAMFRTRRSVDSADVTTLKG